MTDDNTNADEDEVFLRKARTAFEQSVDSLDGQTQSRLNSGRQTAMAELSTGTVSLGRWTQWAPVAGATAMAVVVVVLWNVIPQPDAVAPALNGDFEIIMAEDSFDMLRDLEFYSWVDINVELEGGAGVDTDVS